MIRPGMVRRATTAAATLTTARTGVCSAAPRPFPGLNACSHAANAQLAAESLRLGEAGIGLLALSLSWRSTHSRTEQHAILRAAGRAMDVGCVLCRPWAHGRSCVCSQRALLTHASGAQAAGSSAASSERARGGRRRSIARRLAGRRLGGCGAEEGKTGSAQCSEHGHSWSSRLKVQMRIVTACGLIYRV